MKEEKKERISNNPDEQNVMCSFTEKQSKHIEKSLKGKEDIGMEELHHSLDSFSYENGKEILKSFDSADSESSDDMCDAIHDICENEDGLRKFILYNTKTVVSMSFYILRRYYVILQKADTNKKNISSVIMNKLKNNVSVYLDYILGIDIEEYLEWYIRFLLVGFDPYSDEFDASDTKEYGEALLNYFNSDTEEMEGQGDNYNEK